MNNLYFACSDCKIYIDAGYRWAYWKLEHSDVVSRKKAVSVESVLVTDDYWHPPADETSRWLYEGVFPPLKEFLRDHGRHRVVFGELEDFAPVEDYYLDWMQVGYCLQPLPRYLAQVLGFRTWEQVDRYMTECGEHAPAWWECTWCGAPSSRERAQRRFEELVREKKTM